MKKSKKKYFWFLLLLIPLVLALIPTMMGDHFYVLDFEKHMDTELPSYEILDSHEINYGGALKADVEQYFRIRIKDSNDALHFEREIKNSSEWHSFPLPEDDYLWINNKITSFLGTSPLSKSPDTQTGYYLLGKYGKKTSNYSGKLYYMQYDPENFELILYYPA